MRISDWSSDVCSSDLMVSPTVKITGNSNTARTFADNIDVDVSDILEKDVTVAEAGDALYAHLLRVASGTMTASEVLNQTEHAISRFEPSLHACGRQEERRPGKALGRPRRSPWSCDTTTKEKKRK